MVAKGYNQEEGIDFLETFSPVSKPSTMRLVLVIATIRKWPIHQLDVKNAFLNGYLNEEVYIQQLPGFINTQHPSYVCKRRKSLYGLKQDPRVWFGKFSIFLLKKGFFSSSTDSFLFIKHYDFEILVLLLFVNDMLITGSSQLLGTFVSTLKAKFAITDLGSVHYFLGIEIAHAYKGLLLSQQRYTRQLLEKGKMTDCMPIQTPIVVSDTKSKGVEDYSNASYYMMLVGS